MNRSLHWLTNTTNVKNKNVEIWYLVRKIRKEQQTMVTKQIHISFEKYIELTIEHKNENKAVEELQRTLLGEKMTKDNIVDVSHLLPLEYVIVYEAGLVGNAHTMQDTSPVAKTNAQASNLWKRAMFMFSQTFWKCVDQMPDVLPCKPEEIVEFDTVLDDAADFEIELKNGKGDMRKINANNSNTIMMKKPK